MLELHNPFESGDSATGSTYPGEGGRWWRKDRSTRKWLVPFSWSVLGIAATTLIAYRAGLDLSTAGVLYLIMVVFSAATGGFWSGTLSSIVAALCLDFFFATPIFHFDIDDPMDWVALGTFEFTAMVITLLQERVQQNADEGSAARRGSERLFNAARGILAFEKAGILGDRITQLIRQEFELEGVMLFDAPTDSVFMSGQCVPETEKRVREIYLSKLDTFDPETHTRFVVLSAGERTVGSLALSGTTVTTPLAQAIASLCAVTLERARAAERETHAEAARQTEQLRSAVIEALAHQIKTPLCVIQVASSSLPSMGELSPTQVDLITSIDDQATKLNDLVTRLLGTADLETAQIEPILNPAYLSALIHEAVRSVEDQVQFARFQVSIDAAEAPALVDRKLIVVALTQLVDNAVKYSVPRSPIIVSVALVSDGVSVRVKNQGRVIAPKDRELIFERFYRAADARQGPVGTGLGLSIARRIVEAHRGRIGVESDAVDGTVFEIVLPLAPTI